MSDRKNLQIEVSLVHNPFDRRDRTSVRREVEVGNLEELALEVVPKGVEVVASINGKVVPQEVWAETTLKPSDSITFLPTTGDSDVLRIVAFIAVAIVSAGVGALIGGMAFTGAWAAGAAASVAVSLVGNLIINALLPYKPEKPESIEQSQNYSWSPATTQQQGTQIPVVYGTHKVHGNIIAANTEYNGEDAYINAIISLGVGPYKSIRDIKINDQPNPETNFKGVEIESKLGYTQQEPITIGSFAGGTKTEYTPGVTLTEGAPYTYTTPGSNFDRLEVVISWPQGLVVYSDNGNERSASVEYSVAYRKVGTVSWQYMTTHGDTTQPVNYSNQWVAMRHDADGNIVVVLEGSFNRGDHYDGEPYYGGGWFQIATWRWIANDVGYTEIYQTYTKSGDKAGKPLYERLTVPIYDKGQYEIRVEKVSVSLSRDNNPIHTTVLQTVREVEDSHFTYPREALVGVNALASEQLSGQFSFSAIVDGRKVRVWNGTSWNIEWSSNPAWITWDILTQPVYDNSSGATSMGWMQVYSSPTLTVDRYDGFDPSSLDLDSFYVWAQYCDDILPNGNKRVEFNGVFDYASSPWDAALKVCEIGRASLVRTGTKISVVIEKPWTEPKPLISVGNMVEGSFKESFLSLEDRAVEIEATYNDKDLDYNRTVINVYDPDAPSTVKKQTLDLRGITSADEAWRAAKLRLELTRNLKRFVEFEMALDAVGFTVGDVVDIQADVPKWGFGGRIQSGTTTSVVLDKELTLGTGPYSILLRLSDGTRVQRVLNESEGNFGSVSWATALGSAPEKYDIWAIGETNLEAKPFRIMGISKSGDLDVSINAIEYNESVYGVDTGDEVLPVPSYSHAEFFPPAENLSITEKSYYAQGNILRRRLDVSFIKPTSAAYSGFKAYYNIDGGEWVYYGAVGNSFSLLDVESGATYEVAVVTVGQSGRQMQILSAPKASITVSANAPTDVTNPYMAQSVVGLGLKGGGTVFNTKDCHIVWDAFIAPWVPANWFDYFKIEIRDSVGTVLRTETTKDFEYVYRHEAIKQDGLNRDLTFRVWVVDVNGTASSTYSELIVSNPQAGQVQNPQFTAGYLGGTVSWDELDVDDLAGYEVHLSTTNGFSPGPGTLSALVGANTNNATFSGLPGGTLYAKVGAFDSFGRTGMVYSAQVSAVIDSEAPATDPEEFKKEATETFNVPILHGYAFTAGASSFSWNAHDIYHGGIKYSVASGSTPYKYTWWDVASPSAYQSSDTKPTLDQSAGQFHIAVYYGADDFDLVWHAAPNQVVGSLYVQRASINTAHIDHIDASTANITNIWADKIKVGGSPVDAGGLAAKNDADWLNDITGTGKPANYATNNEVFRQSSAPTSGMTSGDFWFKTTTPKAWYEYNGSSWVKAGDITGENTSSDTANVAGTSASTIKSYAINGNYIYTNAGAMAYEDLVEEAKLGSTIISGGYIRSNLLTADNIVTGTLTGRTVQTSTSGKRVVMSSVNNELEVYNSSGVLISSIGDNSVSDGMIGYFNGGTKASGVHSESSVTSIYAQTTSTNTELPAIHGYGRYLGIKGSTSDASGSSIGVRGNSYHGVWGTGTYGVVADGSSSDFYASGSGVNYAPFTGSHEGFRLRTEQPTAGDILVDTQLLYARNVSNTIFINELSRTPKQKNVVGVYVLDTQTNAVDQTNLDTYSGFMYEFAKLKLPSTVYSAVYAMVNDTNWQDVKSKLINLLTSTQTIAFNSIGEGMINVCPEGGNIEAGDYICSSSTPGKGMKQDDDLLHNYTVAKARESMSWTQEEIVNNVVKVIACTYHCG